MYARLYKHVLNPLFECAVKRRRMLSYRRFLEKSQWWPRERLLAFQWGELKKLLAHCYCHVPYWRGVFDSLGITPDDIRGYEDFCRLPVTTKSDIRLHEKRMIADGYQGRLWRKLTGGSTGTPLELHYTADSYDWRVACWKRGYAWAGCEDGMRQFLLWGEIPAPKSRMKRWKENVHNQIMRKQYFVCHSMDEAAKTHCVAAINKFKPRFVVGYANPLFAMAQFIQAKGTLYSRPQAVMSAAEKLFAPQRKVIESAFGCKVFNTYGCREVMLIGAECEAHEGLHISAENLFLEILDEHGAPAKSGEQGDVILTDLHNYGMPLIRYANDDIAILSAKATCSCGRSLPLLDDVVGRTLDIIRTPDGRDVAGEYFVILMLAKLGVDRYRFVQEKLDYLVVELIRNPRFSEKEYQDIQCEVAQVVGPSMKVDYRFVEDLPVTRTGKLRVTVSNVPRQPMT